MKLDRYWPLPLRIVLGIALLAHGLPKLGAGNAWHALRQHRAP
jgi:hypothetical protein